MVRQESDTEGNWVVLCVFIFVLLAWGTVAEAQRYSSRSHRIVEYNTGDTKTWDRNGREFVHSKQPIINKDQVVFDHAQREANLLAKLDRHGYEHGVRTKGPKVGHPLGCAPGCSESGTGYSNSATKPIHCLVHKRPERSIVARARAKSKLGYWFWSAHYR